VLVDCSANVPTRLKLTLDLPKITPRPPVPPKPYKKVLGYISSALSATATPTRGAAKFRDDISNSPLSTPSKTPRHGPPTTPRTGKPSRVLSGRLGFEEEESTQWITPAVRALCKTLDRPEAAPHVFAGVFSVLQAQKDLPAETDTPTRKRKRKSGGSADHSTITRITERDISALIIVIAFLTISELDEEPEPDQYIQQRGLAIKTLRKHDPQPPQNENDAITSIEYLTREAQNGWLEMDWYRNIAKNGITDSGAAGDLSRGIEDELAGESEALTTGRQAKKLVVDGGTISLRGGFGTMFNDSADWLSEARKADYVQWKSRIISEINDVQIGRRQ